MGDEAQPTRPKRVFVSDVDSYSSQHIAKFLSTYVAGETSEEEEDEEEAEETSAPTRGDPAFQVVGTVTSSCSNEKKSFLLEQYTSPARDQLLQHLMECDVVVYNISDSATQQQVDEATWAITALSAEVENFKSRKMFVLVSTVMTWAMTKPQNPEETDVVVIEEEFRRRRPHPSFKNHNNLEKLVLKLGRVKKSKLVSYVVAAGLQYGKGENLFHYFFKASWLMQTPEVPVFGQGANHIPTIHVRDLAGVIQNVIEARPKSKYVLAVDESANTLEDIVKMISETLGPGKINKVPEQEVDMKVFKPEELQCLSVDLRMEALAIKDFSLRWASKSGMAENMEILAEEYRDTRQLLPIRICVVGPPSVGKTTVSEKLCRHYRLHHIQLKEVIQEKIAQLQDILNVDEPEHAGEEAASAARAQLDDINKSLETNAGRLDDRQVCDILRAKLNSKPCRNQGFVLDGFPDTHEQARPIFLDEDAEDNAPVYNKMITPEHVIALDASDDFLTKRVQELPERVAEEMHYTQDEFLSRLATYRRRGAAEETLLDFFDELEIHPERIEVTADDPEYADIMAKITRAVGAPKNYGLSPEERAEEDREREEETRRRLAAEAAERKRRKEAALAAMAAQYEEWRNLREVQKQEDELQEAHALPLRNYLMKHVMPSLTAAMTDCCKIKPEDPVDFLAEHLLRNNQQD